MKKIMIMIAAVSLLVACGGNSKKDDKKKDDKPATEQQTTETKQTLSVEDQAVAYNEAAYEAINEGDYELYDKIVEEGDAWYESLSEEEQARADKAREEWEAKTFGDEFIYGDKEGDEYYDDEEEEYYDEEDSDLSVEEQAVAFCMAYASAENEAEQAKIDTEVEKWLESLSEEDQMKAAIAMANWLDEFGE